MGLEGCSTFSQPRNLFRGLFSTAGSMVVSMVASFTGGSASVSGVLLVVASLGVIMGVSSRRATPLNTSLSEKETALHLFLELYYTPCGKVWFTSSRQISLLHPELKGPGVCHCLLTLDFLDILAGKDRVRQWKEILLAKTWQCKWSLVVILHLASPTHPFWESKRGVYLTCQLFMVVHFANNG